MADSAENDEAKDAAIAYIHGMYAPYHDMIGAWKDWFAAGNAPGVPPYTLQK